MSVEFEARIPTVDFGYLSVKADNYSDFVQAVAEAQDVVPNLQSGAAVPGVTEQAVQNLANAGLIPATPQPVAPQQAPSWAAPTQQAQQQFQAPAQQQQQWQPTAPQQQAGQGPAPQCNHGERTFKSGTSQKGPWTAWFCPQPKGSPDQCKPIFN